MSDLRMMPVHEIIEAEIGVALNVPGLAHIETKITTCSGEEKVSAKIDFISAGEFMGVTLFINTDQSFILLEHDDRYSQSTTWTAEEADPDKVKAVILDVLRARVRAAA
jgi:hypothetical protein